MPSPEQDLPPDAELAERFATVTRYEGGEGWSGAVEERATGRQLHLKVLAVGAGQVEGSLLASLRHPGIPQVLETGVTAAGRSYLLRDHLAGEPLTGSLPLAAEGVVDLAVQLLEILAYVHLRGVLHLDIKPANVLRLAGEPTRYALLDFGLGRRGAGVATGGTFGFASPEVLLGLAPDARADLFSLGATLMVALTGRRPPAARFRDRFPREDFFAVFGADASELPAPLDTLLPPLLERRREHRLADAQEALELLVGGTGRPSVALLRPDPIAQNGGALSALVAELPRTADLTLVGPDLEDLKVLALHAGCELEGVDHVEIGDGELHMRRGGARDPVVFRVPPLDHDALAAHLASALCLNAVAADSAARHFLASGRCTAREVGDALVSLVERGRVVPDGPRWSWPDAASGRIDLDPTDVVPAQAKAVRRAAARGHVEAAMATYRRAAPSLEPTRELELRTALVEGLIRVGEAGRALPLVHDLPAHRLRVDFELGNIDAVERALPAVLALPAERRRADLGALERLRAEVDLARGRPQEALERTGRLVAERGRLADRTAHGFALMRCSQHDKAEEVFNSVLRDTSETERPFLRAAALSNLAVIARARQDLDAAEHWSRLLLQQCRALGHVRHTATAQNQLGILAKDRSRFDEAREHLRGAQALFRHVGDRRSAALCAANLGIVALESGDAVYGARRLETALRELDALGATAMRPLVLVMLARAHAELGNSDAARHWLDQAAPIEGERIMREADKVNELLRGATPGPPDPRADTGAPTERSLAGAGGGAEGVLRTFLAINRRLAGEVDLERAMQYLLDTAVALSGGRLGCLLVKRADGVRIELRTGGATDAHIAYSRSIVNRSLQQRLMLTSDDALADGALADMPSVRDLRQRSAICVPFVAASGIEGAIYVEHPSRAAVFGAAEKEHLEMLADQAAIAVDRMANEERLSADLERSRRDLQVAVRAARGKKRPPMLGRSKPMRALREQIDRLARSDLSVLVRGETGTGKELVARALHDASGRARGPFVAENCSAIPTELMESELFGHVKGAFTGADEERAGLMELAAGGTLFLDEVGDLALPLQAKLLRALQEGQIRRVGGHELIQLDVRVVAATHRDLRAMCDSGEFRSDLYYRIAAAEIEVPPLRDRAGDVRLLAEAFVDRLNAEHRREVSLSDAGRAELAEYGWPGNVRELDHVIARAYLLCDGDVLEGFALPARTVAAESGGAATAAAGEWPAISLAEAESRTIRAALRATHGDKAKAARILQISRSALYAKMDRIEERARAAREDGDGDDD